MGKIFIYEELEPTEILRMNDLIFSCRDTQFTRNYLNTFEVISLNKLLAKVLLKYKSNNRQQQVIDELNTLMNTKAKNILVTDIDILFNPNYDLNMTKYFLNLARSKRVVVVWPGIYEQQRLIYSEPQYADYMVVEINHFEVTCLI